MARVFTWTVVVYDTMSDFPTTGDVGVIYIDASTNKPYRYDDSYYPISSSDVSVWGAIGSVYKGSGGGTYVPYTGATGNVDLGEYELKAGQLEFDQTPTGTAGVGIMRWNDQDGTADLGLKGGNVTLQIGQEQVTRVVNKTGSDLLEANYQAVRISGAQGNRLKVDLAQANNDANSTDTIGIVTETINNNQEGFVTTSGLVRNIDTTGSLQSETWADGDMLYLSGTTAGRITNVKPSAPTHTIIIGYVVRAHATQGQIYVKVDNGYELDELHNVAITSVANNDVLQYDSATSLWKNESLSNAGIQPTLVSGTSIKTVNSTSLLGSGDVAVQPTLVSGTNIKTINGSSVLGSGDLVVSGGSGLQGAQIQFNNTQGQSLFGFNAALTAANSGTGTPTASRLDVYPVTPNRTLTNVSLTINVSTLGVGALARLVVYSNSNSFPTTKLYESTDIDCSTTGDKTVLTGLTFTAGTTYWLGFYSNGGATFRTIVASQMLPLFAPSLSILTVAWSRISTTLGTAPNTFNYNTYSGANQINIVIKQV